MLGFKALEGSKLLDIPIYDQTQVLKEGEYNGTIADGTNPNSWGYNSGAFGQVTHEYEVLVVADALANWTPDSSTAIEQIYAYRAALV